MPTFTFTPQEKQATLSLACVFMLRMLGLFLVLPVFALYAEHLTDATPFLIGLALGIYGFTQALLQIPFGRLSDYINRKKIITLGLIIFMCGSLLAAFSDSIWSMILARALQGASAVGSASIALVSDLTSEKNRSQAMAFMGISIGGAFFLAMMLGPLLNHWLNVSDLFLVTALLTLVALVILWRWVPHASAATDITPSVSFKSILYNPALLQLNFGILALHALLTTSFIAIPHALKNNLGLESNQQWMVFLPVLVAACVVLFPLMKKAERDQQVNRYYFFAITALAASQVLFWCSQTMPLLYLFALFLFFTAFSLLEAWLPSFISKTAPPQSRGTAMGIYSCCQFVGIFLGGLLGGWLYGVYNLPGVFCASLLITIAWLLIETTFIIMRRKSWQVAA